MENKNLPDLTVVKGLIATTLGVILVLVAYEIVLKTTFFLVGVFLIYYGLAMLNIPAINNFFIKIKTYLNKFLS